MKLRLLKGSVLRNETGLIVTKSTIVSTQGPIRTVNLQIDVEGEGRFYRPRIMHRLGWAELAAYVGCAGITWEET